MLFLDKLFQAFAYLQHHHLFIGLPARRAYVLASVTGVDNKSKLSC